MIPSTDLLSAQDYIAANVVDIAAPKLCRTEYASLLLNTNLGRPFMISKTQITESCSLCALPSLLCTIEVDCTGYS